MRTYRTVIRYAEDTEYIEQSNIDRMSDIDAFFAAPVGVVA